MVRAAHTFLAIDLGASNGRVMIGRMDRGRLDLSLAHRFEHEIRHLDGHKRWDWPRILQETLKGLALAAELTGDGHVDSISCDSWAQDFGLLDGEGCLIYTPVSYRDARSEKLPDSLFRRLSPEQLIRRVGVGLVPITTLCQLHAMSKDEPFVLEKAASLLHIAELIHHHLCGKAATDWTMATASQLRSLATGEWDRELMAMVGIPHRIMPEMIKQPAVLGLTADGQAPHPKLLGTPVVVGASHDTAAASMAAEPLDSETLFLSAGTYAMLGCVCPEPAISMDAVSAGCAMVGLANGRWGLFVSAMGLWIIQECLRELRSVEGSHVSHEWLAAAAGRLPPQGVICLSRPQFHIPGGMLDKIRHACGEEGLKPPCGAGEVARLVFDSLANEYAGAARRLESFAARRFRTIRVGGGGSRNGYLCQRLADLSGMPVLAGSAEATTVGNVLLQGLATGVLPSMEAACEMLRVSFPMARYQPNAQGRK